MKCHAILSLLTLLLGVAPNIQAQGFNILVPRDSVLEANSSTLQPFSIPSSRLQQVYLAGSLIDFDPNAVSQLTHLYFRLDTPTGTTINNRSADLLIRMSTTPRAVDSLSPVFSENIGADERMVFNGTILWNAFHQPGNSVQGLDLRIDLQQPFSYRPSQGNLLIDFTVGNSIIRSQLDAWDRPGDSVSSVFGSSSSPSGTARTLGLVTYFGGAIVVPEPSTFALFALGAAGLLFLRNKRKP